MKKMSAPAPKKNNYDFLKKSQIYNKKSKQTEQERSGCPRVKSDKNYRIGEKNMPKDISFYRN